MIIFLFVLMIAIAFYLLSIIAKRVKRKSRKYIYSIGLFTVLGIVIKNLGEFL